MSTPTDLHKGMLETSFRQVLEENEHYKTAKNNLEKDAEYVGTVGKVASVLGYASLTLATLGIGCCATGHEKVGIALICADVPLLILAHNTYRASENFRTQVLKDPTKLMVLNTTDQKILLNVVVLRKCLLQETLFFEPFVGLYARTVIKSLRNQQ